MSDDFLLGALTAMILMLIGPPLILLFLFMVKLQLEDWGFDFDRDN